jgi:hypothetical protein
MKTDACNRRPAIPPRGTMFATQACMATSKLLGQILLRLGTDADAVAATLREHGITGVRNTARNLNPIVRFAQSKLRLDDYRLDVTHGDGMATYILRISLPGGTEEEAHFPVPVKEFLDAFNRGSYPDMELR